MSADETGRHLDDPRDEVAVDLHRERLDVGTTTRDAGGVRLRTEVTSYPLEQRLAREVEDVSGTERVPVAEGDSGEVEVLPDGSVSVPVLEEVLVVTKEVRVRERVVVRKSTVVDEHVVRTELRREHVAVEAEGDVEVLDPEPDPQQDPGRDRDGGPAS